MSKALAKVEPKARGPPQPQQQQRAPDLRKPPASQGPVARPQAVNRFSSCFFVTKHSWKGKYTRFFCIANDSLITLKPETFEETNAWKYDEELTDILPSMKQENEFILTTRKDKASKKLVQTTFSTPHRLDLLTAIQANRAKFVENEPQQQVYSAFKHHWSDARKDTLLCAYYSSFVQLGSKGKPIARYWYKDIEAICLISDYPGGFAVFYGGSGRMHLFALEKRDELLRKIAENATNYLGITLKVKKKTITLNQFRENRLGRFSNDASITSLTEFNVNKVSVRHQSMPVARLFCTTEKCIIERDPSTYSIVCARDLCSVAVLVRNPDDPQKFSIEYKLGDTRTYLSTDREAMLASLLDSIRAAGNRDVLIQMHRSLRGERFSPLGSPPDELVESVLLRCIGQPTPEVPFSLAVLRFNMNIEFSGLQHAVSEEGFFKENKEKLIFQAIRALLQHGEKTVTPSQLAGEFMAIRRLVASKAGFGAFTMIPEFKELIGPKVVKAIQKRNDGVTFAALDMLATLMQPMHEDFDIAQEQMNKKSLLGSKPFLTKLAEVLREHAKQQTGALVVSGLLDIFSFTLCPPYCETTDGVQFDNCLKILSDLGRDLFHLFDHPSLAIVKSAGMLMRSIIEEGTPDMVSQFQYFSLAEGAILRHLHTALYTQSLDSRLLTHRQLSRHLISLWTTDYKLALDLMKRILPAGMIEFLNSTEEVPEKDIDRMHIRDNIKVVNTDKNKKLTRKNLDKLTQHWRAKNRKGQAPDPKRPVTLRRRREGVKSTANWEYFYYSFYADHARADLIWNYKTREELRECLESQLRAFLMDKDSRGGEDLISWNHTEFELRYETLAEEVKIGDHYLRLLLEDDPTTTKIHNAPEFFNDLYHRFLLTTVPAMKAMCLQALAVVYGKCFEEIGGFNDTEYFVTMLNRCEDHMERDRLLEFLSVLLKHRHNVKLFIDAGGMKCLINMVTLAHMHTQRATVPLQTNVIEASASQLADDEKEWFYSLTKNTKDNQGPIGFIKLKELYEEGEINRETRIWAQGMEGWKTIRRIEQLKWTLVASGTPIMDMSQLTTLCLNMMIRICDVYPSRDADNAIVRPLPRAKRMICDANCLPHLVQLLLTFDPIIVEKVAALLSTNMTDNSQMSRVYQTGVFFFILMYTGSNIMPIAKFLEQTHKYQAFQSDQENSNSVLGNMLPRAMICFLENHGAEKFATTFLGEFDTPEVIWGNKMRTAMIQKVALHLADFTPRLRSNTRALYQYVPCPKIQYDELEDELFCGMYYLRHLCDEVKFPDWPIKDFVQVLKDILDAWKVEVDKKPQDMSMEEAYGILGLETDGQQMVNQSKVRKAYFKMSMKYHPDKNPEGRDMFEKVNKAYEFISSKDAKSANGGPQQDNLVLILKAQSILFRRFKKELQPYKYAGYWMLIETIKRETEDENLFSSSVELLGAACELAYYTVDCSNLNAEELRREKGIDELAKAFQRCISVTSHKTSDSEVSVKVCTHILHCFNAAAQFEGCRERIMEIPQIIQDTCRCLWYLGAPTFVNAAMDCVSAFAVDSYLQNHMLQAGVLWHLLVRLFNYDYTLEEGTVEVDASTNKQKFDNNNAKLAIKCLARLGGYGGKSQAIGTPENPVIQKIVGVLLTPYLNGQINGKDNMPVLKLLNINSETPYLIWDNGTRAELIDYLEANQTRAVKSGDSDASLGEDFEFSAHKEELVIANVFVRIYNEQPTFVLRNPREFASALMDFLGKSAQYLFSHSMMAPEDGGDDASKKDKPEKVEPKAGEEVELTEEEQREEKIKTCLVRTRGAMQALRNVIRANRGVELLLKGQFKLIFSLLRYEQDPDLQYLSLEVISTVIATKECVNDIASAKVLVYLLMAIETLPKGRKLAVEVMHGLVSNPKIVVEALDCGSMLYFLDLYCSSTNPAVREDTASLLGKMITDKLRGPKVRIMCSKFLPTIFMDAMQDNAESSVSLFEGVHENPELIWNEDARSKVISVIKELKGELFESQKKDPSITWGLPHDFEVVYETVGDDIVCGGVFLGLLVKQPQWQFRKPKEFLVQIMEKYIQVVQKPDHNAKNARQLEIITTAMCSVFRSQKELTAQVASLGHLHKVCPAMKRKHPEIQASLLRVMNELAEADQNLRTLATIDSVGPMKMAMDKCEPSALAPAMELMCKLFEFNQSALVAQALKCKLPQFLLALLKAPLDTIDCASAAKAHCVKGLKAMSRDLAHGAAVEEVLAECEWWASYKDQRHDLFITQSTTAGYLTGPTTGVAGYLMAAPTTSASMGSEPPKEEVPQQRSRLQDLLGDEDD
eukprot:m.196277 g.196277  ORF g.196277 m.196277 type:complete len:2301 (-) comp32615_c0_seq1:478-7380(-)